MQQSGAFMNLANTRVILIGGTSNAGKSTLAAHLAARLGWTYVSTDTLARHPGRPWKRAPEVVPPHVAKHYLELSTDELIESVQAHYRRILPTSEALIRRHAEDAAAERLVLEGSALWPDLVAGLRVPGVAAVWLTAAPHFIAKRIHRESLYAEADARGRRMIDAFVARSQRYGADMAAELARLGLASVAIDEGPAVEGLADRCLERMRSLG
jgi:2-phosphoglycerate kinase